MCSPPYPHLQEEGGIVPTYIVFDWNGELKWTEIMGCYFVDPHYVQEFREHVKNARPLLINSNCF